MDIDDQDPLSPTLGPMDTSPVPPPDVAAFLPVLLPPPNSLPQDPTLVYIPNPTQPDLPVNPSNLPIPVFLNPIDAPTNFLPDLSAVVDTFSMTSTAESLELSPSARSLSISPSQSLVSTPSIHSPYISSVLPSFDAVLDPVNVPLRRADTQSHSSTFPPAIQITNSLPAPLTSSGDLKESVSQKQPQTSIGKLLKEIAITAISAGDDFENGPEQTTKVGQIRDRVVQVLDMLAYLSFDKDATPLPPVAPPIPDIVPEQPISPPLSIVSQVEPPFTEHHLTISDQSRKRSASELEEHRTVKSLKREPQDDASLSLSMQEAPNLSPTGLPFVSPTTPQSPTYLAGATNLASTPPSVSIPITPTVPQPTFAPLQSSWPDTIIPTRHHHSLSGGPIPSASSSSTGAFASSVTQSPLTTLPVTSTVTSSNGPPIGRMARSDSISGNNFRNSLAPFPFMEPLSEPSTAVWHTRSAKSSLSSRSGSNWYMGSEPPATTATKIFSISSAPATAKNSPPSDDEDEESDSDSDESISGKAPTLQEYSRDVDRIFFEFLNKLCSNLEATDSKGDQIHQTLMAKKMQRLDESPDFRPFKFRILAFTIAFMDELAKQGYPDDKIPMKKARHYLWRQQYIMRFNEDGRKAKSKGNHTWNIEARKVGDGSWEFRPFYAKLAGTPPLVAYCGISWSWKPHVWHPQLSFKKTVISYSSPNLPSWLSWKNGELSGVPPPDVENSTCQITAVAKYVVDGKEDHVSLTFKISIAPDPSKTATASFPPKRSTSDSALFQIPQRTDGGINRRDDTRVIRVLQNVAQRVTDEAESQFVSTSPPKRGEFQDLVKQKHVLEQTVDAYDKALSGQGHKESRRLAVAAQHVVLQAAKTVMADRTVAIGGAPSPQAETVAIQSVSVHELTNKTQDAIAMAVKMNGTASNEVDIIVTATSILKSQTAIIDSPTTVNTPPPRSQPTSSLLSRVVSTFPSSNLSPLPEYV